MCVCVCDVTGEKFLCCVSIAPVKNELSEIVLFIINLEDISESDGDRDSEARTPGGKVKVIHFV